MTSLPDQAFSKKFWSTTEIPDPSSIVEKTSKKSPRKKKPKAKKVEKVDEIKNPCSYCAVEITDVPFKYDDFKFCQMRCLRAHRFENKK